jgi:hypothetical protein
MESERRKPRKDALRTCFRRRAAIEPVIGHEKADYGLDRNYLKGEAGDKINAMLAASAFNFRSWMRKAVENLIFVINYLKIWWLNKVIKARRHVRGDLRVDKFKPYQNLPQKPVAGICF